MRRRDWAALKPCGTPAAYRRHLRRRQHCTECLAAEARRKQDERAAARAARQATP